MVLLLSILCKILNAATLAEKNGIDFWTHRLVQTVFPFDVPPRIRVFWIPIIERIVLNLSDQQLLTGIAVLVASFWTHCSISVYHFSLACDLGFFSSSAHLVSLQVLGRYLNSRRSQRNWRVVLMVLQAILLAISCVLQGHRSWYNSWSYEAQCLFDDLIGNVSGKPGSMMAVNLILIVLYYSPVILSLYKTPSEFLTSWLVEQPRAFLERRRRALNDQRPSIESCRTLRERIRLAGISALIPVITLVRAVHLTLVVLLSSQLLLTLGDVFWFVYSLYGLIGDRDIPPSDMNGSENSMSFGQIVPILLLSSTIFVAKEAYDGKC